MADPKIGIYRIVGSELPPRDLPDARLRTISRIFDQDPPEVATPTEHWILNRIVEHSVRRKIQQELDRFAAHYVVIPVDLNAVRNAKTFPEQVCAAININAVRNWAIEDGQARGYDWTIVLDGDCLFDSENYQKFVAVAKQTKFTELGIPSVRAIVLGDGAIQPVGVPNEPMLAFHKDSKLRFDPTLPFGAGEKLKLCAQLGYSMERGNHAEITTPGRCENAGVVQHLSCDPAMEETETNGELRNQLRQEALQAMITKLCEPRPSNAFTPFNTKWKTIPGFFDFQGPYSGAAADVPDGEPIAEVGCWLGASAHYLATELKLRGKTNPLFCIDTWFGGSSLGTALADAGGPDKLYQKFLQNMSDLPGRIFPIRMTSVQAASLFPDGYFAAVFLDAGHLDAEVTADLQAWYPKVREGGLLFGHDYVVQHPDSRFGVVAAVDRFFAKKALEIRTASRVWKHVKHQHTDWTRQWA